MHTETKAVLDRIVDNAHAVLLIGEDEVEEVIPVDTLPEGATEGTWLHIHRDETGQIATIDIDETMTAETEQRITSKLDQLRRRGRHIPRNE